jgi:hypothetical protein
MRPKAFLNRTGLSVQLWKEPWPWFVFTVWFGPGFRLRPRLYFWLGTTRR